MEQVNWDVIMENTLLDVLGPPLEETEQTWHWAGKDSTSGEKSRSLKYDRQGKWAGCFKDWSTGEGGGVYKFLLYWCNMEKSQASAYLREKGWLPQWNGGGMPRMSAPTPIKGATPSYNKDAVAFYDALADNPEAFTEAFINSISFQREEDIKREKALVKKAWTDAPDPMFETLEQLCRDDPTDEHYRALQVHTAARSYCMEMMIAAGIFPPQKVYCNGR